MNTGAGNAFLTLQMASHEFLYNIDEAWIASAFFIVILIETHLFYRIGSRRRHKHPSHSTQFLVGFMPGALVTLLALFYAFTISMAEVRFEARRQYLVDEANSIEMTFLRTRFLPKPDATRIIRLLSEYVDTRIQFYGAEREPNETTNIQTHFEHLQIQLWLAASAISQSHPTSIPVGQFIDALNQIYTNRVKQIEAYENRVPDVIIALLLMVTLLGMASVGYAAGASGSKHLVSTVTLAVILAITLFAILDIDRPRRGLARLNYDSLIRVQEKIARGFDQ